MCSHSGELSAHSVAVPVHRQLSGVLVVPVAERTWLTSTVRAISVAGISGVSVLPGHRASERPAGTAMATGEA